MPFGSAHPTLRYLFPQQIPCDKEDVRGPLGQTAHEVRVPLSPKRDVDADVVPFGDKHALQVAPDTEEHLELEAAAVDPLLRSEGLGGVYHLFVVCGKAVIDRALQQQVCEFDVVR